MTDHAWVAWAGAGSQHPAVLTSVHTPAANASKGRGKAAKKAGRKAGRKNGGGGFGRAGRAECVMEPPLLGFTADVAAATGVCSNGRVRIAPSPGKGLGAFAVCALSPAVASGAEGLTRGEHQVCRPVARTRDLA